MALFISVIRTSYNNPAVSGKIVLAEGASIGSQNSILLNHRSVASGNYYVFTVGSEYYACKIAVSTTSVYASFGGYGKNSNNIYSASAVTIGETVFTAGSLYRVTGIAGSSGGGGPGR